MSKIVFDIETIGIDFANDLDEIQQEYLLKYAKTDDEKNAVKEGLGLYPVSGKIVAIAFYNPDTQKGGVYFSTGNKTEIEEEIENVKYKSGTEKDILEWFWADVKKYDQVITFNGRCFDVPFVIIRSAINGVKCTKKIMGNRWGSNKVHIDLLDELTFQGAFKKFNLDFYCKAFGIKSSKSDTNGHEVFKMYKEGKGFDIAKYCVGDVVATAELFEKWEKAGCL